MSAHLQAFDRTQMPIRKAIRRVRWFLASFRETLEAVEAETGQSFDLDEARLTSAFMSWCRAFEAQKPRDESRRRDYVTFAAGLMLRELIHFAPVRAKRNAPRPDPDNAANFWPEGYLYVTYCLAVREAVLEQDFTAQTDIVPELKDIRTWWSFRENTAEDRNLAIGFLELFSGETPHWSAAGAFPAAPGDDDRVARDPQAPEIAKSQATGDG